MSPKVFTAAEVRLEADWSLTGRKATEYTTKFLRVCFTFTSKRKKKNPNAFVRKKKKVLTDVSLAQDGA